MWFPYVNSELRFNVWRNKTVDSEKLFENEVSKTRDVSQLESNRDRGQISQEIQCSVLYYKDICVSKKNCSGTQYVDIDEWGSGVKICCLNHAFSKIEDLVPKSQSQFILYTNNTLNAR